MRDRDIAEHLIAMLRRWFVSNGITNSHILEASTLRVEKDLRARIYIVNVHVPHLHYSRNLRLPYESFREGGLISGVDSFYRTFVEDMENFLHDPMVFMYADRREPAQVEVNPSDRKSTNTLPSIRRIRS